MKYLYLHSKLAIVISLLLCVFIPCINTFYNPEGSSFFESLFSTATIYRFVLSMAIYYTNYLIFALLSKYCFSTSKYTSGVQQLVYFVGGIVISFVSYYFYSFILQTMFFKTSGYKYNYSGIFRTDTIVPMVLISIFIMLIVWLFILNGQMQKSEMKEKQTELVLKQAELASLKEQLSPHFLFNNLNVLISVIQESPLDAEKFVRAFAKIYRYILEQIDNTSVLLKNEIDFAKEYMYLMNVRYDNAINFEIADEVFLHENKTILTLTLQALLDNIVKHNTITSASPLQVTLSIENNQYLVLSNQKIPRSTNYDSTNLGLANLQKRYLLAFNESVVIENTISHFIVKLPIHE